MNETKSTRGVMLRVMFVAALVLLFAAAGVGAVSATEHQVANFNEFKTAVENTASDGDTIKLTGAIQLSAPVILNRQGTFIIDGNGCTISATDDANFGADGCLVFGNSGDSFESTKNYTLKNVILSEFTEGINDVVRAEHCVMTIDGCTFNGNEIEVSPARSGAVVHTTGSQVTIVNSVFMNNDCGLCIDFNTQGGEVNSQTHSTITVDNCYFKGNTISSTGVIYTNGPVGTIKDSTFESNTISSDGAGVIYFSGKLDSLTGCLFKGNSVTVTGSTSKCGVLSFGSGAAGTVATGNAFDANTLSHVDGPWATAYVGADNINLSNNYWGGHEPILGSGKDIYSTKTGLVSSPHALSYAKSSIKTHGIVVSGPKTTEITYESAESYILTIPASFAFTAVNDEHAGDVKLDRVVIGSGKQISVKMSSTNYNDSEKKFYLKIGDNDNTKVEYTLIKDADSSNLNPANPVLKVNAGTDSGTTNLKFKMTGTPKYSGSYKDTLTFSVSIEDEN